MHPPAAQAASSYSQASRLVPDPVRAPAPPVVVCTRGGRGWEGRGAESRGRSHTRICKHSLAIAAMACSTASTLRGHATWPLARANQVGTSAQSLAVTPPPPPDLRRPPTFPKSGAPPRNWVSPTAAMAMSWSYRKRSATARTFQGDDEEEGIARARAKSGVCLADSAPRLSAPGPGARAARAHARAHRVGADGVDAREHLGLGDAAAVHQQLAADGLRDVWERAGVVKGVGGGGSGVRGGEGRSKICCSTSAGPRLGRRTRPPGDCCCQGHGYFE
jgi:hypothetical protein